MTSAIFIPSTKVGTPQFEFVHEDWTLGRIKEVLDVEFIESVNLGKNQIMYIDDPGMAFKPWNPLASVLFWRTRGSGDLIFGNALVMGYDQEGESANVHPDLLLTVAKMATAMMTEGTMNELA
jgi:hypothetical protein